MVRSGEAGGALEKILKRLSDFSEKQLEIQTKIRTALAYPILMSVVGLATIIILMTFVIPKMMVMFADLGQITTRIDKLEGNLKKPVPGKEREELTRELQLQQRLSQTLEAEKPLTEAIKSPAEEKLVRAFAFLTLKPLVVVVNCGEGEVPAQPPPKVGPYEAIFLSAKIEEELARLEASERAEFMAELGIAAPAQDRLVRLCYHSMRLVSFLTAGEKEVRAWTIPSGTNAQLAAGAIHTDLQRGFIRAEIVAYVDLVAAGDEKSAKAAGKYRLEGKDYIVKDGDVVLFRFSV